MLKKNLKKIFSSFFIFFQHFSAILDYIRFRKPKYCHSKLLKNAENCWKMLKIFFQIFFSPTKSQNPRKSLPSRERAPSGVTGLIGHSGLVFRSPTSLSTPFNLSIRGLVQNTMCTSVHPWTGRPAMNLARHHSVDIEMGEGSGTIQSVRIVCWGRHKYVSGFPIDWPSKYWSRLLMWRLFLSEGETDSEWDYTSWVGDLHWFLLIFTAFQG